VVVASCATGDVKSMGLEIPICKHHRRPLIHHPRPPTNNPFPRLPPFLSGAVVPNGTQRFLKVSAFHKYASAIFIDNIRSICLGCGVRNIIICNTIYWSMYPSHLSLTLMNFPRSTCILPRLLTMSTVLWLRVHLNRINATLSFDYRQTQNTIVTITRSEKMQPMDI